MSCIDVCMCKMLMSSLFIILFCYPCFIFKLTCKSGGAGFHDLKLYACIYQIQYVTIKK